MFNSSEDNAVTPSLMSDEGAIPVNVCFLTLILVLPKQAVFFFTSLFYSFYSAAVTIVSDIADQANDSLKHGVSTGLQNAFLKA